MPVPSTGTHKKVPVPVPVPVNLYRHLEVPVTGTYPKVPVPVPVTGIKNFFVPVTGDSGYDPSYSLGYSGTSVE